MVGEICNDGGKVHGLYEQINHFWDGIISLCSSVSDAKGDDKRRTEAPFLGI